MYYFSSLAYILYSGGFLMNETVKNAETTLITKVKSLYKGSDKTIADEVCNFWISAIKNDVHMNILSSLLSDKYALNQTRQNYGNNLFSELPLLVIDQLQWDRRKLSTTQDVNPNILMKSALAQYGNKTACGNKTSDNKMQNRRKKEYIEKNMKKTCPIFSEHITVSSVGKQTVLQYPFFDAEYYSFYFYKAFYNFLPDIRLSNRVSLQQTSKRLTAIAEKMDDNSYFLTQLPEKAIDQRLFKIGQLQFLMRLDDDFCEAPTFSSLQILPEIFALFSPAKDCSYYQNDRNFVYLKTVNRLFNATEEYRNFFLSKHFFFTMLYMWDFSDDLGECSMPMLMTKAQIEDLINCAYQLYQAELNYHNCMVSDWIKTTGNKRGALDYYLNNHMLKHFTIDLSKYVDTWILDPIMYMSYDYRDETKDKTVGIEETKSYSSIMTGIKKEDEKYLAKVAEETDDRLNKSIDRLHKYVSLIQPAFRPATFRYLMTVLEKNKR